MRKQLLGWALGGLGLGVLAGLYATFVEPTRVRIDRFTVAVGGAGLPPGGLTILHLCDLHFRATGAIQAAKIAELHRLLARESYDLVALTGDLIHDISGFPVALSLIESLQPRWGMFSCPGNHDHAEYSVWAVFGHTWRSGAGDGGFRLADAPAAVRQVLGFVRKVLRNELLRLPVAFNDMDALHAALRAAAVHPLVNQAVHLQDNGLDLWIAGLDDLTEGRPDLGAALAGVPESALLILLSHNPDVWLDGRAARADLILCGHTHGGQVRLPLVGAIHTQGTHLSRRRPAGWFTRGRTRMFVSRGLGESIPLRFGVRPQAALIRLIAPGDGGAASCS